MQDLNNKLQEFSEKFDLTDINFDIHYSGRTYFQMERFVMCEHDLPERKFLQLMMELKSIRDGFVYDSLEVEKLKIQIKRLLETGDEIDKIEAMKKQYSLEQFEAGMVTRERELNHISTLLRKLPKVYTFDEIEAAEERYWNARLTRQAAEEMVYVKTGIHPGNMKSNIQARTSISDSLLKIQAEYVENLKRYNLLPNAKPEDYYNQVVFSVSES